MSETGTSDVGEILAQDANLRDLVRVEQVDMAIRLAPLMIGMNTFGIYVLAWLLWNPRYSGFILGICALMTTLAAIGLPFCWRWRNSPRVEHVSGALLTRLCLYACVFGAASGIMPVPLYIEGDMQQRMLIASTCAGMIGTAMTVSVSPALALSFMIPIVGMPFYSLTAPGDRIGIYVAVMLVLYAFFLCFLIFLLSTLVKKRVIAQMSLEREQALTNLLLNDFEESANDWLWETDAEMRLRHVSDRLSQVASQPRRQLIDQPLATLFASGATEPAESLARLLDHVQARRAFRDILLPVCVMGEPRWWLVSGKPVTYGPAFAGYRGVGADITIKKQAEDRLSYLVLHDALTELPNRVCFQQTLEKAIAHVDERHFAVMCLDLDDFKGVNDTLGHGLGDKLLQAVADRLQSYCDEHVALARLAGDEFAMIVHGPLAGDRTALGALCAKIVEGVGAPFRIADAQANIGVSIGVAVAPEDGAQEIMRRADLALYQSKRNGKNSYRFYRADMDEQVNARRALGVDMKLAIERKEFMLYFQPLVNAATRKIAGFEALIRWNHPTRGLVPPTEFIPLAEETGAITALGKWIVDEACRIAATWPVPVTVAVNISPIQFRHSDIPQIVAAALARHGLPPHRLELELTESAFLETSATTQRYLQELGEQGVRLSLDDFGTGYSSLSYLRRIAFNKIKIDRSFVINLPHDARDLSIVRAIVDIATTMGVATTAEGVETEEQRACLLAQGCHQLQGYLFSPPVPAEQVPLLLEPADLSRRKDAA